MKQEIFLESSLEPTDVQEIERLAGPIVVLGAGGAIGSQLFLQLRKIRPDVYACGVGLEKNWRLTFIPLEWKENSLRHFDISSADSVSELFQELAPQTVFNLCAYGAYENQDDVSRAYEINFEGLLRLIKTVDKYPIRALVNAGSSSEYGLNCKAPQETGELIPNSDYAVAKGAASLLVRYYGQVRGLPLVQLRLYSIYGPGEDPMRLLPRLIESGLKGNYPPLVGADISRDFVYIDDCIRAFVKTALYVCAKNPGEILNLGTGVQTTIREIAVLAKTTFSIPYDAEFGQMPSRKWDLVNWYADTTKLEKYLSWKPRISLSEGLKRTVDWEKLVKKQRLEKRNSENKQHGKKISAVIACYRDHEAIPIMYRRLVDVFNKCGLSFEIIFVNDCSPTNDQEVIHQIVDQDERVIGISHSRNFGSQAAFLSGMEIATGDAVVLFDGDLQDPPEVIEKFVEQWSQGFDVVYGVRVKRQAPIYMQLLYRIFYRIFKSMADIAIPLDAGDFSLIDRKVVLKLLSLKERDFFLRGLRAWVGFKQIGVPYVRPERMFGSTTNNFMKNIWWAKKGIFAFSTKPLDYVQGIGLLTVFSSFVLGLFYLLTYFMGWGDPPRGITTLFILMLGLGGLQIFSMSIIGEYVKKIIEEVKGRPRYIRSEIYKKSAKWHQ